MVAIMVPIWLGLRPDIAQSMQRQRQGRRADALCHVRRDFGRGEAQPA